VKTQKNYTSEDFFFCMQFHALAWGQEICPRIAKNGDKVTAMNRRNGSPFGWTFSK